MVFCEKGHLSTVAESNPNDIPIRQGSEVTVVGYDWHNHRLDKWHIQWLMFIVILITETIQWIKFGNWCCVLEVYHYYHTPQKTTCRY